MPDQKKASVEVTAAQVKALRERTGAGIIDCRNAL
jgi:translation elongation factor EF-Ts